MKDQPTDTQLQVLAFMRDFQAEQGSMPTRVEIAAHFGWKSPNAADTHLAPLRRFGYVEIQPHTARGLRFTEKGMTALGPALVSTAPDSRFLALPVIDPAKIVRFARQRAGGPA